MALTAACGGGSATPTAPSPPSTQPLTIYDVGTPGVSLPTLLRQVKPAYTSEALRNRVQGSVLLAAVVLVDGTVGDVTVLQSLDTTYGLDTQAIIATRQWLFSPGLKDGQPVAVRVTVEMTFTITG